MATCNTLSIDVNGVMMAIRNAAEDLLERTSEEIKKYFEREIYAGGAGRHHWRRNAGRAFHVVSRVITFDIVAYTLGIDPQKEEVSLTDDGQYYVDQIMVALYGNHMPNPKTKPGEVTFHDHMMSRRESKAQSVYDLPPGFYWPDPDADKMLENAYKLAKKFFVREFAKLLRGINFYDYVYVS